MDAHTLYSGYKERNISVRLNEAEYQHLIAIRQKMREENQRTSNSDAIRYLIFTVYDREVRPEAERREETAKRRRGARE